MTTTFGERLRAAREAAGLSQIDTLVAIRSALPESMWISQTKIQRIESGAIPEAKVDTFLALFLADLYGVELADLSGAIADDLEKVADLVKRGSAEASGWIVSHERLVNSAS